MLVIILISCQTEPEVITIQEQRHQAYLKEFYTKNTIESLREKRKQWKENNPQYFDTPEHYEAYRKEKGRQLKINHEILDQIVGIAYKNYLKGMLRPKEAIIIHDSLFKVHGLDENLVFLDPNYFKKKLED